MTDTQNANSEHSASRDSTVPTEKGLGLALLVIAVVQLMISLDNTIVNIALPTLGGGLGVPLESLSWVVTAYAVPFGALLLVGGRTADLFGRRTMFRVGLALLALGSIVAGSAQGLEVLLAGRVLQGVGSAIAAPTAMSLIATTFPAGELRNKALGVYGGMGGLGAVLGLVLGGLLTEYLSWRWVFFVNVPIAVGVIIGSSVLTPGRREGGSLDVMGALTATAGAATLVYAITEAAGLGWTSSRVLILGCVAIALLLAFVVVERVVGSPMVPGRVIAHRGRLVANLVFLLVGAGMFATYYLLTLYMQQVKGYSALVTGLAYLPMALAMGVSAGALGPKVMQQLPPRAVTRLGLIIALPSMLVFWSLGVESSYWLLLAGMLLSGFGLGLVFVATMVTGVSGVAPQETGIASGLINTSQQLGGALGVSVLASIAASAATSSGLRGSSALTHGFGTAYLVGAGVYLLALLISLAAPPADFSPEEADGTALASVPPDSTQGSVS